MKKLILPLIAILLSCSKDDPKPPIGCVYGDSKGAGLKKAYITCRTQEDFNKGAEEIAEWNDYTNHTWELCNLCKQQ